MKVHDIDMRRKKGAVDAKGGKERERGNEILTDAIVVLWIRNTGKEFNIHYVVFSASDF